MNPRPCLKIAALLLTVVPWLGWCRSARAEDARLVLLPDAVVLRGTSATQRVLVELSRDQMLVGDESPRASFAVSDEQVAVVSDDGVVTPVGNGSATLSATVGDQSATATITVEGIDAPSPWSFRNHVLPVLTKAGCNSGACHGAAAGKGGLKLTLRGYAPEIDHDVLTRQNVGRRIAKTVPAESLFLLKPTAAIEHGGGMVVDVESREYRILSEWIGAGAPGPADDDPRLVQVSALPKAVTLGPGQTQSVLVQAIYDDGRVEDVTRWSRFETTDEGVVRVDDQCHLTVRGHGEAAVTVGFGGRVQVVTVTSPYDAPDPERFANASRHNPIDEHNLAKLRSLGIPPSPPADDATFLRRAYLNATGTLPPIEVARSFLDDDDPDRRSRLVDRLLGSTEFVDYWSYRWSDMLLVSSRELPAPAMWSFYRFVRESVADNLPWDEFARRIITARGSTLTEGATNYFVLHRDTIELTENATVAFLGLAMTCAVATTTRSKSGPRTSTTAWRTCSRASS